MLSEPTELDLTELSARADVSPRTIRYYIQQGLLPTPESRGPGAHYGQEHVDRLKLIKGMQREHLPLNEIRRRLELLTPKEIRLLAERTGERPRQSASEYIRDVLSEPRARLRARDQPSDLFSTPAFASLAAVPYGRAEKRARVARSQWERITLAPDVELHLRRPLSREQNRQVERLMEAARYIFEEDTP